MVKKNMNQLLIFLNKNLEIKEEIKGEMDKKLKYIFMLHVLLIPHVLKKCLNHVELLL